MIASRKDFSARVRTSVVREPLEIELEWLCDFFSGALLGEDGRWDFGVRARETRRGSVWRGRKT